MFFLNRDRKILEDLTREAQSAQAQDRRSVINELIEHALAGKARQDSEAEQAAWTAEWLAVMRDEGRYWPT